MNRNVQIIIFITLTAAAGQCFGFNLGGNPIFRDVFTADPLDITHVVSILSTKIAGMFDF